MDGGQFDLLTRQFAGATSRRSVIAGIAAAIVGARFTRADVAAQGECDSDDDCGLCEFCENPGATGTCEFVPFQQDPNNDCPDGNYCSGNGGCSCLGPLSTCTVNEACCGGGNCINEQCCIQNGFGAALASYCCSGILADDVCCDTVCEGACNTCGPQGGSGICTDVDSLCSDGNNCTDDICTAGTCTSSPKDCSDLDELCKGGVCDSQTGTCIAVNNDDGFVCGTNSVCASGQCVCATGFVLCGGVCVAGECCEASDCEMESVDDSVCASMICLNQMCELTTGTEACGPCQECDLETLDCVDVCSGDECCCDDDESCSVDCCPNLCEKDEDCPKDQCCCDDDESCSVDCCPDLCKHDKDCPKGECCCKDGSCNAKCCEGWHETTPPPPPPPPTGSADPVVSTLPNTGTGSTAGGRGAIAGLAVAGGLVAWAATKLPSDDKAELPD